MDTLSFEPVPNRDARIVLGDSYVLGRRLGRGAMGEVYEAQHVRLPGQFAVKLLLPELQGNQDAFARFCREAEIMSQLRHPNIVQLFDFNIAPDTRPYFVMEYLEGRDLEARLQAGPLTLAAITRIVDAVGSALALAHAHGVVHRDLKPANIFLATVDGQTDEVVKVLDFGISKVRAAAAQISQAVDLLGTPSYMAPEQARGHGDAIDGRTDQFALGAITYRMLTGQDPFQGDDTAAVLYQAVHEDPPPLSLFLPTDWDPRPLQAVLDRAMAKKPDSRYGGMMELARAFDDAAERTIGTPDASLAAAARGARERAAPRLDDADIDVPPPVRTPTPLVLRPKRTPAPAHTPPPTLPRTPAPAPLRPEAPRVLDWEVPSDINEIPKTHVRGAAIALLVLGLAALFLATGWYRRLPSIGKGARQRIHEWTRPSSAEPAARAEQARPAAAPAPTAPAADVPAPAAAAPATPTDSPAAAAGAAPPSQAPAAQPPAPPQASARPPAAEEKPRAHRQRSARAQRAKPVAAPPAAREAPADTPPTEAPPLKGGAFEIAPPTPMEKRRDLAPEETLPLSP
jgi:serine/threonine-protein kinase